MSDIVETCDLIDTDDTAWTDIMEFAPESVFGGDLIETKEIQFSNGTRLSDAIDDNTGASDIRPFHLIGNDNGMSGTYNRRVTGSVESNFMQDTPGSVFGAVTSVAPQTPRLPRSATIDSCFMYEDNINQNSDEYKNIQGSSGYNPLLESIRHGAGSPATHNNNGFHGDLRRSDMGLSATHGVFVALNGKTSLTSTVSSVTKSNPDSDRALHRSGNGLSAVTNSNGTSAFSRSGAFTTVRAHQVAPNTPQKRRFPSIEPTLPRQPSQVSLAALLALVTPNKNRIQSEQVDKCGGTPAKKAKSVMRPEESDDEEETDDGEESDDGEEADDEDECDDEDESDASDFMDYED